MHLEALRKRAWEYLLFPRTAFWWLDYYQGFREHLDARYLRLWEDEHCQIYHIAVPRHSAVDVP